MTATLRAAYAKSGLLRMVAHRDMGTHLRRMFQRARLPLSYSQGFNPKPRFHFAPPLPLGATCGEDWIDVDLDEPVPGPEFLERVAPQALGGLTWVHAFLLPEGAPALHECLDFGEWRFQPYQPEEARPWIEAALEASARPELILKKRSKRGKLREVDVRPAIRLAEPVDGGFRVVLGASPSAPGGALGLFDYLRAVIPDLEDHPMTVFRVERVRFLRIEGEALVPAVTPPSEGASGRRPE